MTRLTVALEKKYRVIRLSASENLDPISFQPFDVLLLMMIEVAERTAAAKELGGAGRQPDDAYLKDIHDWFAVETQTAKTMTTTGAEAAAGVGPGAESWWAKALGLFASLRGEIKYASSRAVQEFNGKRWFGVHPLVVDLLATQHKIARPQAGPVPGGTE